MILVSLLKVLLVLTLTPKGVLDDTCVTLCNSNNATQTQKRYTATTSEKIESGYNMDLTERFQKLIKHEYTQR